MPWLAALVGAPVEFFGGLAIVLGIAGRYAALLMLAFGVGANGLVGGLNSFALQPVSVEGQIGLNVVATVTGLELHPVVPVPVRHHRHHRRYHG